MATPADAPPAGNSSDRGARERAARFCRRFGLRVPVLQAPMAGACPAGLASAVANAGGMGGLGALTTQPDGIAAWVRQFRDQSNGGFQINLWIPDPPPVRDPEHEREVREFLGKWGPPVPPGAGDAMPLDFAAQCEALLVAQFPRSWVSSRRNLSPTSRPAASPGSHARLRSLKPARRSPQVPTPSLPKARRPEATAARLMAWPPSVNRWAVRSGAAARGQIVGADHRHGRDR